MHVYVLMLKTGSVNHWKETYEQTTCPKVVFYICILLRGSTAWLLFNSYSDLWSF